MMPIGLLFVVMLIIGFVVAASFLRRSFPSAHTAPRQPMSMDWDAISDEMVQGALTKGNKIEAIKRYRQLTNLGLKEAKEAIDYVLSHPDEHATKKKKATYDAQDAGIRDLIQEGRLDEAVEIYQKFAGVDAYTAHDAVDEIARNLHLSHQTASRTTFEVPPADKFSQN